MVSRLTRRIQHVQSNSFGVHTRCSGSARLTATRVHRRHFSAIPSAGTINRKRSGRDRVGPRIQSGAGLPAELSPEIRAAAIERLALAAAQGALAAVPTPTGRTPPPMWMMHRRVRTSAFSLQREASKRPCASLQSAAWTAVFE